MVYFIQSEGGEIKIGSSANPQGRLRGFQSGTPYRLVLVGTEPGGVPQEKELQGWFVDFRIRPDGEWFYPGEPLLEYLQSLMDPLWPEAQRQPEEWVAELTRASDG